MRAKAIALLLIPDVAHAIVAVNKIKVVIEAHEHGMALVTPAISTHKSAVDAMTFNLQVDHDLLKEIHVLPKNIALKVVFLFRSIEDFDGMIAQYLPECRSFDGQLRAAFIGDIDRKFSLIDKVAEQLGKELAMVADVSGEQIRELVGTEEQGS
jgi:hypothetical protein